MSRARDTRELPDDLEPGAVNAPESTEFEVQQGESIPELDAAASRRSGTAIARTGASLLRDTAVNVGTALRRPLASYHLVLGLTAVLTVLGLVMVLSASSVEDISATGSPYSKFTSQLIYVGLGVVAFFGALYLRPTMLRRLALGSVLVSIALLIAVLIPGIGSKVGGARRWIDVGGFTIQPSEIAKVALIVWGAHLLADRSRRGGGLKDLLLPLGPVALLMAALVIAEPNQSTAMIIAVTAGMLLFYAGLSSRLFLSIGVAGICAAVFLALVEGYRSARLAAWLGRSNDALGVSYQSNQARYSLADGGFFGVGLGNSTAKWSYLPNAHNDFIFAIIGEELGYLGAGVVILMFGLLTWVGLRIACRVADPFLQLMAATITTLIALQAIINMGYVVGLLPVTGIQLPLLSAGGNSVILVLFMLGLLAGAARHEPEAIAALAGGGSGRTGRLLRLPKPQPYVPPRAAAPRAERRAPARPVAPSPYDRLPYGDARLARPRRDVPPTRPQRRGGEPWRGERARVQDRPATGSRRRGEEKGRRAW
ncbi:putative peptidoglycan glycosyltransferase FtsW OS=Tsukamurella paurometabola (strain ATCC 8368 /DSM / CCUG 35730 / CIP 100753 / JCM 10117 / KCTC 9821/ NBRC 16120 / NCIMB 702349 / NCTC 13040) OX=521096 GN=Tpau_2647 PE=3 SV=1 [Tsukamurella paurometabola]|uniref:Probable peptidoglycan glycosyltransferase FtsW n=1 Tax=Tsukamurella paurometabola (strain ATCC 8368 / DSM 20162 / CCUG 35730 / CIP 100753 / JCM 10117 / KCTC 9821 / NBRC 16120 / NCIMB 702349 / NCTC 13040) TaxID=521096 RepID=D5USH6_TSUPD|nr:putative lipid II flippase FtsW [Tsukamurella paurometabola]ADG79247.1 cell division protein FtsW [Tsukamurella paurometabola DSM 20162]SUP34747.1 Cell division protein FtsW [Tsukamurella paurometabola]